MVARTLKVARSVLGQYLLLGLIWGANFLFIKVGLEGLSPGQVVLGRLTVGAVTLGAVSVVTRQPLPRAPTVVGAPGGGQGSGHSARRVGSVDRLTWGFVATGTLLLAWGAS
jgi:drug/metabolite transporter (DMT)-like permease